MAQSNTLTVKPILQKSWDVFKLRFRTICKLLLITVAPTLLVGVIQGLVAALFPHIVATYNGQMYFLQPRDSIFLVLNIIASLMSMYLMIGLIKAQIRMVKGEKPTEKTLFSATRKQFLNYILAIILILIIIFILAFVVVVPIVAFLRGNMDLGTKTISIIFLIIRTIFVLVAGIYFAIRFSLFKFHIAKGESTVDSFKKSRDKTDGHEWKIFLIGLSFIGIALGAFIIWFAIILGIVAILQSMQGNGIIGVIVLIILVLIGIAGYIAAIVYAFAMKELSLTQIFLQLQEE